MQVPRQKKTDYVEVFVMVRSEPAGVFEGFRLGIRDAVGDLLQVVLRLEMCDGHSGLSSGNNCRLYLTITALRQIREHLWEMAERFFVIDQVIGCYHSIGYQIERA